MGMCHHTHLMIESEIMLVDAKQSAAFLAVVQWGSFERAAEALHLSSSAVSQRIRTLESHMGCVLVTRQRPCVATKDGLKLLRYLRSAALLSEEMQRDFSGQCGPITLNLAVNYDALDTWLTPVLAQLAETYPVLFELHGDDLEHTLRWLAEGKVVAAFSSESKALNGCEVAFLGYHRYRMLASQTFAQCYFSEGINRQTLAAAPLIGFNRKDQVNHTFLQRYFNYAADACPIHYVPGSHAYFQAVLYGMGWGMIPTGQGEAEVAQGLLRDMVPGCYVDVPVYWHVWQVRSVYLQQVSERLQSLGKAHLVQVEQGAK